MVESFRMDVKNRDQCNSGQSHACGPFGWVIRWAPLWGRRGKSETQKRVCTRKFLNGEKHIYIISISRMTHKQFTLFDRMYRKDKWLNVKSSVSEPFKPKSDDVGFRFQTIQWAWHAHLDHDQNPYWACLDSSYRPMLQIWLKLGHISDSVLHWTLAIDGWTQFLTENTNT